MPDAQRIAPPVAASQDSFQGLKEVSPSTFLHNIGRLPSVLAVKAASSTRGGFIGRAVQDSAAVHNAIKIYCNKDVYFTPGTPKAAAKSQQGKYKKAVMAGSRVVWTDLDPAKGADYRQHQSAAVARLLSFEPVPTWIMDSGRGVWGLWLLGDLAEPKAVEQANQGLARRLDGDAVANVDRLCRLPGSVNQKTGNQTRIFRTGETYSLADLVEASPTRGEGTGRRERWSSPHCRR